jgi:ketosteroid isomerase-like protein
MKTIRRAIWILLAGTLLLSANVFADQHEEAPDGAVLTALLQAFLAGASKNDAAAHERFWSKDLVYTSSSGDRFGKADIMAGLESGEEEDPAVYSAEDIRIQQFGDTAVVAFRLVATPMKANGEVSQYFNTGTFVKSDQRWQAVAWQATRIPPE